MSGSGKMNGSEKMDVVQEFRKRPQQVLDRLVDGELGVEERRALLAVLDDEPGAWRQCALAFVEAQAFGWQLSRVANEPLVAQESSHRQAVVGVRKVGRLSWPLALAASVLVAFLVGKQFADRAAEGPTVTMDVVAGDAENPAPSGTESAENPAALARVDGSSSDAEVPDSAGTERWLTSLTVRPYGDEDAIELPLVEAGGEAAANAAGRSSAVFGSLAQQFERDGFEVDRQQQYWPVELPDGRSVLVPVEEMRIQSPDIQRL